MAQVNKDRMIAYFKGQLDKEFLPKAHRAQYTKDLQRLLNGDTLNPHKETTARNSSNPWTCNDSKREFSSLKAMIREVNLDITEMEAYDMIKGIKPNVHGIGRKNGTKLKGESRTNEMIDFLRTKKEDLISKKTNIKELSSEVDYDYSTLRKLWKHKVNI